LIIEISIKMGEESGAVAFAPKGRPEALDSVCGAAHTLIIIEISIKMGER